MSSDLLAPGEEIDCGVDDDAENARRLIRVLNTYVDGHEIECGVGNDWYEISSLNCILADIEFYRKFRRVA